MRLPPSLRDSNVRACAEASVANADVSTKAKMMRMRSFLEMPDAPAWPAIHAPDVERTPGTCSRPKDTVLRGLRYKRLPARAGLGRWGDLARRHDRLAERARAGVAAEEQPPADLLDAERGVRRRELRKALGSERPIGGRPK